MQQSWPPVQSSGPSHENVLSPPSHCDLHCGGPPPPPRGTQHTSPTLHVMAPHATPASDASGVTTTDASGVVPTGASGVPCGASAVGCAGASAVPDTEASSVAWAP